MLVVKSFKCLVLFLISVVILTIILYLTGAICLLFEIFNKFIFGCFLGVLHSIIIFISECKMINKIKISFRLYLIFTTLLPALIFDTCYVFLLNSNAASSILNTNISEILYYFMFMSCAFSVSTITIILIKSFRLLINFRN